MAHKTLTGKMSTFGGLDDTGVAVESKKRNVDVETFHDDTSYDQSSQTRYTLVLILGRQDR